ncbi:hypothetical protein FOPE_02509 [Fonsecaea pedrosoi]|nr:hypothetical protein FOPE_02509 [Fonsecaea pedrosoi]
MISPSAAVTSPAAAEPSVNRTTSARRRGLSYLRALSHNRSSGGTSPNEPSRSPRHYFQRSLSYNENRPDPVTSRRRSTSRPNEPTALLSSDPRQVGTRTPSPRVEQEPTADQVENTSAEDMARHRSSTLRRTVSNNNPQASASVAAEASDSAPRSAHVRTNKTTTGTKGETQEGETKQPLPTIRFFPHQEIRNGRPSLNFSPITRTLPSEHSIIRVGRYSEREGVPSANPIGPSDAPVGFKSKVVSRKHCEFSFLDGQWQIKDVASSSGTFLNHIRLSQPNTESRLFPIKDGDIVQLGIDFRGGEEMIFRCVKIRIECNRAWQKKPNNFKAYSDLTADVDLAQSDIDEWLENTDDPENQTAEASADATIEGNHASDAHINGQVTGEPDSVNAAVPTTTLNGDDPQINIIPENLPVTISQSEPTNENPSPATPNTSGLLARRQATNPRSSELSMSGNIDMPDQPVEDEMQAELEQQRTSTQTPDPDQVVVVEGPLTPRNNAGPFVFDGSAGRSDARQLMVPGMADVADGNRSS